MDLTCVSVRKFLKMFEHGLVFRDTALVNYCPSCKVVLSNEDSQGGKCDICHSDVVQKSKTVWYLKITEYVDKPLKGSRTSTIRRTLSARSSSRTRIDPHNDQAIADKKKLETSFHKTTKKVSSDMEEVKFNTAIAALMTLTNTIYSAGTLSKEQPEIFIKLPSPFAPHLMEKAYRASKAPCMPDGEYELGGGQIRGSADPESGSGTAKGISPGSPAGIIVDR